MKPRELMLSLIAGTLALFGVTFIVCKPQIDMWKVRQAQGENLEGKIRKAEDILSKKAQWEKRLGEVQKTIKAIPQDQPTQNYLGRVIDTLAANNGVSVSDRQTGDDKTSSGLHVLPIKCRWDNGNTKEIRDLLIDFLENDVMLDVVELTIVSRGQDQLKGSFTVNCVFTK